jgi:hypothetical protein
MGEVQDDVARSAWRHRTIHPLSRFTSPTWMLRIWPVLSYLRTWLNLVSFAPGLTMSRRA